jgi:uncharacterized protein
MFHFYLALAYIIPNIYVFFRIKNLCISKEYRHWYVLIYWLIAAIYPVSETFSYRGINFLAKVLSNITEYLLPFYLYLFLFVLLFDVLLFVSRMGGIFSSEIRRSFCFRFYLLFAIIILSIAVVIAGAINLNFIRISKYSIEVPKRHTRIDHLRVAFVADLHIQQNTPFSIVEQFVRKVNAIQPDLMLYGGDMVEGDDENETTESIESALRNIHSKYGAYGVPGNHEFYGGQEQGSFFRKSGIILLGDSIIRIDNSFFLAGRNDQHFGQRKAVNEILGNVAPDLPVILMDHRPTELKEVSRTAADIQFSGHTHNGQMFPINLITRHVYDLSWGHKKIRNTHFFVTSGLRLWGYPVKTAGKSEIMQVDIYFK